MKRQYLLSTAIVFFILSATSLMAQTDKEKSIKDYRIYYSTQQHRGHELNISESLSECLSLLQSDGKFSDMVTTQANILANNDHLSNYSDPQRRVSDMNGLAFKRLWKIAESYRNKTVSDKLTDATLMKLFNGIINYGELELSRANVSGGRFHTSCFAIPTAAINSYFCFYELMDKVESNLVNNELAKNLNSVLKDVGMQSWTQPYRNDYTDDNVVQVDRFRKHVWWVGGNGLSYRSVLPASFMMSSVEMVDVLAIVSKGALSVVSQNMYDEAFWTEGFTADGAGWGHGKQCLIWGYPVQGTSSALENINRLQGSPWADALEQENVDALFTFIRGSSYYYYQGFVPPCLGRTSMSYIGTTKKTIPANSLVEKVFDNWKNILTPAQNTELELYLNNSDKNKFTMPGTPPGYYTGTRWFFNNDDLIKKTQKYYLMVNMASSRCDGIESEHEGNDRYNFYTCDGLTLYNKTGSEYYQAMGGWNLTSIPGVTSRQGEDKLTPITNWDGYTSQHNFAAAACNGSENAASGFIFEKMDAGTRETSTSLNEIIYGVKAYKSYFMFGDYMLALGAGITNKRSNNVGNVWTTIDQTLWQGDAKWKSTQNTGEIVKGSASQNITLKAADDAGAGLIWANQENGFSYAVLPEHTTGSVHLNTETRTTKWEEINASNAGRTNLPATVDIFHMWIDHGKNVKEGEYAYITYCGDNADESLFQNSPIKIISNTTKLQAASSTDNNITGAVFYDINDTLQTGTWDMTVSARCAVLVEKNDFECTITVSDAEMNKNLKFIEVRTTLPVRGEDIVKDGIWNLIKIAMPEGDLCSKPVAVNLELDFAGIPWRETFSLADGSTEDSGNTAWSAVTNNLQSGGYAKVLNNIFEIKASECTLTTAEVDISGEKGVNIFIDINAIAGENLSADDYLNIYYALDENERKPIIENIGNIGQQTVVAKNLSGNTLKIIVEAKVTDTTAAYIIDNIIIKKKTLPKLSSLKINSATPLDWTPDILDFTFMVVSSEIPEIEAIADDVNSAVVVEKPDTIPGEVRIIVTDILDDVSTYTVQLDYERSASYVETFENITLTSWGKETYTGDNGFIWNVSSKGSSGNIEGSKNIYMVAGSLGIQSNPIPGGISSFSVQCKDLWDTGVERTIELLINDQVIATKVHTGTEIYTFPVENINIAGNITIGVRNATPKGDSNKSLALDNIEWTSYAGDRTTTLKEIRINESLLNNFDPNTYSYVVETESIPLTTATPTSDKATVDITTPENLGETVEIKVTAESGDYAIYYIELINPSTETIENSSLNKLTLYPNPTNGVVYLDNLKGVNNIKLYSIQGELMHHQKASNSNTFLDFGENSKGIYFVIFEYDSGKIEIQKVIVK